MNTKYRRFDEELRKYMLLYFLKDKSVDLKDISLLLDLLDVLKKNGVKLFCWIFEAEDAIKTLRKDRDLERELAFRGRPFPSYFYYRGL